MVDAGFVLVVDLIGVSPGVSNDVVGLELAKFSKGDGTIKWMVMNSVNILWEVPLSMKLPQDGGTRHTEAVEKQRLGFRMLAAGRCGVIYLPGFRTTHLTLSLGILMKTFSPALMVSEGSSAAMAMDKRFEVV